MASSKVLHISPINASRNIEYYIDIFMSSLIPCAPDYHTGVLGAEAGGGNNNNTGDRQPLSRGRRLLAGLRNIPAPPAPVGGSLLGSYSSAIILAPPPPSVKKTPKIAR